MELILILLGSFLFGPFILAAAAAAELFVATVGVLLDMAFARRAKRASGPPPVPSVWPKRLFYTGSGLALVTFLLVAIVNWFWFAGFVRWSLDRIETRSGVRVAYESVEGLMWTGELRLKNASIVKSDGERLRCDLQVQRVDVDVAVLSLLSPSVRVERLVIDQPVGTIRWPSSKKSDRERRARRSFEISEMEILGMDLQLQRGKGKVYRLQVPEWRSAPLRSGWPTGVVSDGQDRRAPSAGGKGRRQPGRHAENGDSGRQRHESVHDFHGRYGCGVGHPDAKPDSRDSPTSNA